MTIERLIAEAVEFLRSCPENYVSPGDAIRSDLAGMRIFDDPIFAVGSAHDPLFRELRNPDVVHPETLMPEEFVEHAESVVSFFLPFTEQVRRSNYARASIGSDEWLHARVEGQIALEALDGKLCALLLLEGEQAVAPATDSRFKRLPDYRSNWSERHTAYICGLGTFGLSRGLITARGLAGRFGSIVTSAVLPVTSRPYSGPFDYCTMCGKCAQNCPADAIDISRGIMGKDIFACAKFVDATWLPPAGENARVRYGCGKCNVNVPCENGIPLAALSAK